MPRVGSRVEETGREEFKLRSLRYIIVGPREYIVNIYYRSRNITMENWALSQESAV